MQRRLSTLMIAACVGLLASACPSPALQPANVDISGMSDELAAETIADTMCEHYETCGQASFSCSSSPNGQDPVCTGELEYMDYDECYQEVKPDILDDLEQVELTAAEEQLVNSCINAMVAQPCMTQADVDDMVEAMNNGEEPDWDDEIPVECEQLEQIFGGDEPVTEPEPAYR